LIIQRSPLKPMTGSSVTGHLPGAHFGLSKEPFSGGKPPLPGGATISQQLDSTSPDAGVQTAEPTLTALVGVPPPPPHAATRIATHVTIAAIHFAWCRKAVPSASPG